MSTPEQRSYAAAIHPSPFHTNIWIYGCIRRFEWSEVDFDDACVQVLRGQSPDAALRVDGFRRISRWSKDDNGTQVCTVVEIVRPQHAYEARIDTRNGRLGVYAWDAEGGEACVDEMAGQDESEDRADQRLRRMGWVRSSEWSPDARGSLMGWARSRASEPPVRNVAWTPVERAAGQW